MEHQVPVTSRARADRTEHEGVHEIAPDLGYQRLAIVNVVYHGAPGADDRQWVLVDTGVMGTTARIVEAAARRFGEGSRPAAIILTHGHFDHVAGLPELADRWEVPVYAHTLEHPYLDGRASYPPPDPTVGGGLMSSAASLYPSGPINVGGWLRALPDDGSVPGMAGWRWIHTPGHSPGHVSLWRDTDRTIIAGDAFITTKQESAYAVLRQETELHGPPMYFTPDWESARDSVRRLASLEPELAITGHGHALHGPAMRAALHELADRFDEIAVPKHGRYVDRPARADASGPTYVPPAPG